jgi:hypothetical protein
MTKKGSGKQAMGNADFGKQRIVAALGAGPAKFGPYTPEVTAQPQLKTLPIEQLGIFAQVTIACEDAGIQKKFTTSQMLRVLRFTGFTVNENKAFSLLKRLGKWNSTDRNSAPGIPRKFHRNSDVVKYGTGIPWNFNPTQPLHE